MTDELFVDGLLKRLRRHSDALEAMSQAFIEFSLAQVDLKLYLKEFQDANPTLFSPEDLDA